MKNKTSLLILVGSVTLGLLAIVLILSLRGPDLRDRYKQVVSTASEARIYVIHLDDVTTKPDSSEASQYVITDRHMIQELFGGLELELTEPCQCAYLSFAVIHSPQGKCIVMMSEGSVEVSCGQGRANFKMPPNFLEKLQALSSTLPAKPITAGDVMRNVIPER